MRLASLLGLVVLASPLLAADKQPIRVDDLFRFETHASPLLTHDGQQVLFVRQWIDGQKKRERFALWSNNGTKAGPLEPNEPDARQPLLSPDGKWLVFLSTRPRPDGWKQTPSVPPESEVAVDLWLMPTDGGKAIPLLGPNKPYGRVFHDGFYGRVAFSPDGKRLVFVADDGKDPRSKEEIENEVIVVRPDQGEGYTGYGTAQLSVAQLDEKPERFAASKIERVTDDDVWYGDPRWSPDSKFLVVHANVTDDRESVRYSINKNYDLWAIDLDTKKRRQLTTGPGPEVSPRFSPDGKKLICLSVPRRGSHRDVFNLAVVTLGDSGASTTILYDRHGPEADRPPHFPPSFPLPDDCWDDADLVLYNAEQGTKTTTMRVNLKNAKGEPFTRKRLQERDEKLRRLVPPSNTFLKERALGRSEVVTWDNNEKMTLEGILTLPPEGVSKAPYPLIVYPHGGPHSRSVMSFNFTVEVFAAHGYAVFQPNFRGSSGYGQKFIDADHADFGGGDMRDILTGIDSLVKRKVVDRERQYVYGTSYGGFMTTWLVGQTHQFKAAVAQNAVTDLNTMWGLSDIPSWTEWEFNGRPWETPALYRKHSPFTHVGNIKTPTLILHSREDRRCPLPMGQMFHQALVSRKVPTQMVIYPGEGHGIRQPKHRADVLQRTLAWFEKYR